MRCLGKWFAALILAVCPLFSLSAPPGAAADDLDSLRAELAKARAGNEQLKATIAQLEAVMAREKAVAAATRKAAIDVLRQEVEALRNGIRQSQADRDKDLARRERLLREAGVADF